MKIETLKKIVNNLGYSWEDGEHPDSGKAFIIDKCLFITETDKPVLIQTISGDVNSGRNKWLVEEEIYDSGGYWEPPSSDFKTIGMEDSLEDAVRLTLFTLFKDKVDNTFESESMEEGIEDAQLEDW